jgi:tetratricopeptide (TPR) repeat protein
MKKKAILLAAAFLNLFSFSYAQTELKKPEPSQACSVEQTIGLTNIKVMYHSPLVNDRKIWDNIVPYNEVWRAGANENTTVSFSTDVKVEGIPLAAGSYGLHMIPGTDTWTLILSKNDYSWGSFFYSEKDDALRATIKPKSAEMQNWLSYTFSNPQAQSVRIEMHWEKLTVPFLIEVDVPETVYKSMKKELSGINGFFWQGHNQAAAYCISNNVHLDEATSWVDKSIAFQKNFNNLTTKARLLEKQNKTNESALIRKEALELADETQINAYGYELLGQGKTAQAKEYFILNVKRYPKSWNVYDSLGEVLDIEGDKKNALIQYNKAYSMAPDNQKKRIDEIRKRIEKS